MSTSNLAEVSRAGEDATPTAQHPESFIRFKQSHTRTRVFSLLMLCVVLAAFGYAAHSVYWMGRDAFVVPAILSPESEVVVNNRLRLSELAVEKARAAAELLAVKEDIAADEQGVARLSQLSSTLDKAVQWTHESSARMAAARAAELKAIMMQREMTESLVQQQTELTRKAEEDLASGIISRTAFAKERQTLEQLKVSLIEKQRAALQQAAALHEISRMRHSTSPGAEAPLAPELASHEEHKIRIELETMRLQSDKRSKVAQLAALVDRVEKIEALENQLKSRPFYQAVEKRLDLAFVPYAQIEGVQSKSKVYDCLWGLFGCKPVGVVREVVPGETLVQDPWGVPSRGQYAVLDLWDRDAAKSKTLRVRPARSSLEGLQHRNQLAAR